MQINSVNSNSYNFGSYSSIKKQAESVIKRVRMESESRKAEQNATGMMKNAHGDIVEISSIPEWEREELERRARNNSISPHEALLVAIATAPHTEEVEKNKELAAKATMMQNKVLSGQKLSGDEKSFLQANFPGLASLADRMDQESEQLKISLRGAKSKSEANQIYMDAKIRILSGSGKDDGSILFLLPAIDKAFNEFSK